MNAGLIPTAIVSLFLVCIILGFVFGWFRGFSKSLVRFIIVLAVTVLAFFVVPSITTAVLKMDISKLNINIGGVSAVTLGDLIIDLIEQVPIVQDLIESSPTLASVITLVPQMLANVVLFIAFFFIFKWFSMIIYWIIAGIFFSKKKMGDKDRHKFVGAVIGTVQGFLVAIVLMVPIFGVVETSRPMVEAIRAEQTTASTSESTGESASGFTYTVNEEGSSETPGGGGSSETPGGEGSSETPGGGSSSETPGGEGSGGTSEEEKNNKDIKQTVYDVTDETGKYVDAFDKVWIVKVMKALKIQDLSVSMFDNLTTVKDRDLEVSLRNEVKVVASAYPGLSGLIYGDADIENAETYDNVKESFDKLYASPVLSGVVSELVPKAATRWSDTSLAEEDRKFCGIAKPDFGDAATNRVFDALLLNLATQEDSEELKKDIDTSIDVMKLCCTSGIVTAVKHNGDLMEVLLKDTNKNLVSNIIDLSLNSSTLKECLPDIINLAMSKVYTALNITDAPEIHGNLTVEEWQTEKLVLQNVFNNVLRLYDGINKGTKEGKNALDCLDFAALGRAFDGLRSSKLLSEGSLSIMTKLMDSDFVVGADVTIMASFKEKMTAVWNDPTVKMEDTFVAVQNALVLAKDLKNAETEITPDNIGEIINGLKDNETLKGTVNEILNNEETMKNLGLDETTAGVVKETISSVINHEYNAEAGEDIQKDINAISEVYNVANKVMSSQTEVTLEKTDTDKLVESIANSTVIKENLTKSGSKVGNLDFTKLDAGTKTNLKESISDTNNNLTEEERNALLALFGVNA